MGVPTKDALLYLVVYTVPGRVRMNRSTLPVAVSHYELQVLPLHCLHLINTRI
jgi:hypothetical protein